MGKSPMENNPDKEYLISYKLQQLSYSFLAAHFYIRVANTINTITLKKLEI